MPIPNKGESRTVFLARCIPQLIREGKEQDQAVAVCYSLWKNRNKKTNGKGMEMPKKATEAKAEVGVLKTFVQVSFGIDYTTKQKRLHNVIIGKEFDGEVDIDEKIDEFSAMGDAQIAKHAGEEAEVEDKEETEDEEETEEEDDDEDEEEEEDEEKPKAKGKKPVAKDDDEEEEEDDDEEEEEDDDEEEEEDDDEEETPKSKAKPKTKKPVEEDDEEETEDEDEEESDEEEEDEEEEKDYLDMTVEELRAICKSKKIKKTKKNVPIEKATKGQLILALEG